MFIIEFQNGTDWYKPNWVFRQLVENTRARFPTDTKLAKTLEVAQAFGLLDLGDCEQSVSEALRTVAQETVSNKITHCSKVVDSDGKAMYVEALREFLRLLENSKSRH